MRIRYHIDPTTLFIWMDTMRENFLIFGAPCIEQAEIDEVVATLKSG